MQDNDILSQVVALGASPDTAYYTIRPTDGDYKPIRKELDIELQDELDTLKKEAQQLDESVATRWAFEGETLYMKDKGGSQFKWIMENKQISLSLGRGKKTGVIGQVRLSSEYLWSCRGDLGLALAHVHAFLTLIYGQFITLDMSGLDLAVDVLNLDMNDPDIKEHFISRAIKDKESTVYDDDTPVAGPSDIDRQWKKLTGLTFGRHTSAVSAVIYDKTSEIKYQSKKTWMFDIWDAKAKELGIEYNEGMTVWRIEVRFKRLAFREFPDSSNAYDVLGHIRDLWAYGVGAPDGGTDGLPDGWLRYVVPTADTNRARWPVHPAWQVIQHAYDEQVIPEPEWVQLEQEQEALLQEVDAYLSEHPLQEVDDYPDDHPLAKQRKKKKRVQLPTSLPVVPAPTVETVPFIRTRKRQVNVDRGIAQMVGWLSTIEAWRMGYAKGQEDDGMTDSDISTTLHFLMEEGSAYMERKAIDFSQTVHKKRALYGLEQAIA